MSRKDYKEELEKKEDFHQLAIMEFTDLLKTEHNIDSEKIHPQFYDVLGIVLSKFHRRIINSKPQADKKSVS